jgi:polynucleotide 5'-kinase involved in rRNA processing
MQNPSVSEESEMRENKIGQNRANINFESNTVVKESIFNVKALGLQRNQEKEKQVDEIIIQAHTLEEESMTHEETPVHVQMQENASYQPSTNFVFVANPAYGTDIYSYCSRDSY